MSEMCLGIVWVMIGGAVALLLLALGMIVLSALAEWVDDRMRERRLRR